MIQWGILGMGNIAKRFMKGLSFSKNGQLYAVASLTPSKRDEFSLSYPDIKVYESYEDLLNDDQIDAVYIALRHADHYRWAKEALLKNKAVLCEKPATLSYEQTKELCELSKKKHTFFMEGMKTRFIPMIDEIKSLIEKGVIGEIQRVETSFCSDVPYNAKSYLFDKEQGGALYDVGIYNVASILDYIQSPIAHIQIDYKENYGIDIFDDVELTFESGQSASIRCAIDRAEEKSMRIIGTLGEITATPFYRPIRATVTFCDGESFVGEKPYVFDDFYGEIEEVHRCIGYVLSESEKMTHQDSLDCIEVIEKIKESMHG